MFLLSTDDIKTFVAETLHQIVAGISEAQSKEPGNLINAKVTGAGMGPYGNLISADTIGMFTQRGQYHFDELLLRLAASYGRAR
jgi:hypothetical protein